MKEEQIIMAYIAGVLDGDGSFSLIKRKNGASSPLYQPMIQLANANKNLVELIKSKFGGTLFERVPYLAKDGAFRKTSYSWKLSKIKVGEAIPKVLDYLILKKERAEYLIRYIATNPFIRGSVRLTQEVLDQREKSYAEMIRFNDERRWATTIEPVKRQESECPLFWSYVAGLLDTDGSFSIKKEIRTSCKSPVYSPCILLTMIDPRGINFIRKNCLEGTVTVIKSRNSKSGICYRFAIHTRQDAIKFLKKCLTYLLVKKPQAEILLKFCESFNGMKHRRSGLSKKEIDIREEKYQNIIYLNKHGVYKPSLIDLEAQKMGDRAEGESHGERLSERDSKECATV